MSQDCGACKWFLKIKGSWGNSGLCRLKDRLTDTDCGHQCPDFQRPKFNRNHDKKQPE